MNNAFFDVVPYVGAFDGTNNWTATWANFNPEIGNYYNTPCSCGGFSKTANTVVDAYAGDMGIFPNPTSGNFKVDIKNFNGNVNLKVINLMNGSLAYSTKQTATAQKSLINVNGANLAIGFYSVEVSDGSKHFVKKLSITK